MARTKSVPMRRKAYSNTIRAASSDVKLSTTIHRILNSAQELKVYYGDTSYTHAAVALNWLFYINPLTGITQGTTAAQRLGDRINVKKIDISVNVYNTATNGGNLDFTSRTSIIRHPDPTLSLSTATTYTGVYNSAGFYSNGILDKNYLTVLADRKYYRQGNGSTATGATVRFPNPLTKTFGLSGTKVEFKAGATTQSSRNLILMFSGDTPQDLSAGAAEYIVYVAYAVYYRDA